MADLSHRALIDPYQHIALLAARVSLFVIFFWFGILKVFNLSPANPLVEMLQARMLPFWPFENFIVFFGMFEVLLGILFLIPRLDKISVPIFFFHMCMAVLPLILLPGMAWSSFLVPTLEGQYIIKNMALIALALSIIASHHLKRS